MTDIFVNHADFSRGKAVKLKPWDALKAVHPLATVMFPKSGHMVPVVGSPRIRELIF